jgi:hypothetical protein
VLDVHAITGVPGAATVLGAAFPTICIGGDGATVAGVPLSDKAILAMWGGLSIAANTIGAIKLQSQDQIDPINGEAFTLGAASLLNAWNKYTKLQYKTGGRSITMGTNNAVGAASAYLIDVYPEGETIQGDEFAPNQLMTLPTTFGGALTIHQWGTQPYAPATAIPNGKYAILGAWASAMSYGGLLRFSHADFKQYMPGFPVSNFETISSSTWDKIPKDELFLGKAGYQFVHLSDIMGTPCCPVFNVTNTGTGLTIWALSAVADTPVVHLNLIKVG